MHLLSVRLLALIGCRNELKDFVPDHILSMYSKHTKDRHKSKVCILIVL